MPTLFQIWIGRDSPACITNQKPKKNYQFTTIGRATTIFSVDFPVFTTIESKYIGQSQAHKSHKTEIFFLVRYDKDDTNRRSYRHNQAVLQASKNGDNSKMDSPVIILDVFNEQANAVYCQFQKIESSFCKQGLVSNTTETLFSFEKQIWTMEWRKSYDHHIAHAVCIGWILLSWVEIQKRTDYMTRHVKNCTDSICPNSYTRLFRTEHHVLHRALGTVPRINCNCLQYLAVEVCRNWHS